MALKQTNGHIIIYSSFSISGIGVVDIGARSGDEGGQVPLDNDGVKATREQVGVVDGECVDGSAVTC